MRFGPTHDGAPWHGMHWLRDTTRMAIYLRDHGACVYCGAACVHEGTAEVDHVAPRSTGGTNAPDNLVTSCFRCNASKGSRSLRAWLAWLRDEGHRTRAQTDAIVLRVRNARRRSMMRHRKAARLVLAQHAADATSTSAARTAALETLFATPF